MAVFIIVAHDQNRVIGKDGKIPWHIPNDLRRFKEITSGNIVIMGRKTWESIPLEFRPLKKRLNIVITSKWQEMVGTFTCRSLETALEHSKQMDWMDIFLIGGQRIYEEGLKFTDWIIKTELNFAIPGGGDTYFPKLDNSWAIHDSGIAEKMPGYKPELGYTYHTKTYYRTSIDKWSRRRHSLLKKTLV